MNHLKPSDDTGFSSRPDAPDYDTSVEKCFPLEAMSNPQVFFDAIGDEAKYTENLGKMMESCGGFIDFGRVDIISSSQFDFAHLD